MLPAVLLLMIGRFGFELQQLTAQAEKADSPEKRLRYTSIMELIEREIPMLVH